MQVIQSQAFLNKVQSVIAQNNVQMTAKDESIAASNSLLSQKVEALEARVRSFEDRLVSLNGGRL